MVGSDPLINKECRIYWKSPSTELPEPIDLTKEYTSNNAFFQVYFGIIRRYTHTDEKVKIELEDRSQLLLQTKIPLNDVEGEWQKLVEECIGRLLKLIEKPKDRESIIRNITKHIHTEAISYIHNHLK